MVIPYITGNIFFLPSCVLVHRAFTGQIFIYFFLYSVILYIFQVTQDLLPWQAEISLPQLDPESLQLHDSTWHNLFPLCGG